MPTCLAALVLCALFGWIFREWRPATAAPLTGIAAVFAAEVVKQ